MIFLFVFFPVLVLLKKNFTYNRNKSVEVKSSGRIGSGTTEVCRYLDYVRLLTVWSLVTVDLLMVN